MSLVLALTSRTHLWSRDVTCTGFNIKNSPVITWCHLYWLQHQELTCDHVMSPVPASTSRTHLWSHDVTCTGFNTKNSLICDVYNYQPKATAPVSGCMFYQVEGHRTCLSLHVLPGCHIDMLAFIEDNKTVLSTPIIFFSKSVFVLVFVLN